MRQASASQHGSRPCKPARTESSSWTGTLTSSTGYCVLHAQVAWPDKARICFLSHGFVEGEIQKDMPGALKAWSSTEQHAKLHMHDCHNRGRIRFPAFVMAAVLPAMRSVLRHCPHHGCMDGCLKFTTLELEPAWSTGNSDTSCRSRMVLNTYVCLQRWDELCRGR